MLVSSAYVRLSTIFETVHHSYVVSMYVSLGFHNLLSPRVFAISLTLLTYSPLIVIPYVHCWSILDLSFQVDSLFYVYLDSKKSLSLVCAKP